MKVTTKLVKETVNRL